MDKLTAATEKLVALGVNHFGGEFDGAALTLTDTFGPLRLPVRGGRLTGPESEPVDTQRELTALLALARGTAVNAQGLTEGTLITSLGVLNFKVRRALVCSRPKTWSERIYLYAERPMRVAGLGLDAVALHRAADPSDHYLVPLEVRMAGAQRWRSETLPQGLSRVLLEVLETAFAALFTPEARHAARVLEIQERLDLMQRRLDRAQYDVEKVEAELWAAQAVGERPPGKAAGGHAA